MSGRSGDIARDYNRGLARPVRAAHAVVWGVVDLTAPPAAWVLSERRRDWALPAVLGLVAVVLLLPLDGLIAAAATKLQFGGDVRRELYVWQQFGALGSLLFASWVIATLDPDRRRRLLDLLAAVAVACLSLLLMKMLIGRVRPRSGAAEPWAFLGPWGQYPVEGSGGELVLAYAWQLSGTKSSDLWSMPSSHAGAAAVLAVFLVMMYPRLRWVGLATVGVVGFCRVAFGAHWPSDVAAGVAVGFGAAQVAVGRFWGVRSLDWLWIRLVDRQATPSLSWVLEVERQRLEREPAGTPGRDRQLRRVQELLERRTACAPAAPTLTAEGAASGDGPTGDLQVVSLRAELIQSARPVPPVPVKVAPAQAAGGRPEEPRGVEPLPG